MSAAKVVAIGVLAGAFIFSRTAPAQVGNDNATGPAGEFDAMVTTAGSYDPYTGNATRSITDLVMAGGVGSYPLAFTRTLNSRYSAGVGPEFGRAIFWSHSYQWSIEDEATSDNTAAYPPSFTVNYPDGRSVVFGGNPVPGDPYLHGPPGVRERFQRGPDCYLHLPDGGKIRFHMNTYREQGQDGLTTFNFDFTGIIDPHGHDFRAGDCGGRDRNA